MEQWKVIPRHPCYAASSEGRIKRVVADKYGRHLGRVMKLQTHLGYNRVLVTTDGREQWRFVHRLVCEAFNGPCPEGLQVAHNNGIRDDNRPENLRWSTPKANSADKRAHGTMLSGEAHWSHRRPDRVLRGERNRGGGGKLTEDAVRSIRKDARLLREIAPEYGVSLRLISLIRRREAWSHVKDASD